MSESTQPRPVPQCENCDRPLNEGVECRCDSEGLWFCADCWQALAEDFGLIPKT